MNELTAEYLTNGLTYKSNNESVITRDAAGNIQVNNSIDDVLIIESVTQKITMQSALRVLDTRFNYYKFPVTVVDQSDDLSLDTALLDIQETPFSLDLRYRLPNVEIVPGVVEEFYKLATSYKSRWFNPAVEITGPVPVSFIGADQLKPYTFTLTPDIISSLKSNNKTILFTIFTQGLPQNTDLNTAFNLILRRTNDNQDLYRNKDLVFLHTETKGNYNQGNYPILKLEYILNINDIFDYDTFAILMESGNPAYLYRDTAVWNIKSIDNPTIYPQYGVSSIGSKTDFRVDGKNGQLIIDGTKQ